ncbi:MAG: aromatic acid exporter family protein [Christensenellales bacterium]|nr:aromatic acid exporter family protein [Christensenellales bacterium]
MEPLKIPGVGMRTVKTALTVAFCTLIYYFIGRSPAFACIGVIFGMGCDLEDARKNGGNRLFGTIIGGVVGILLFRLYQVFVPDGSHSLLMVPLVFIGTIVLIIACQMFWPGGVQPGGVVLCILLFNTPVATYIDYAMNRILDTAVGVLMALFVSYVFPRGWMENMPERCAAAKREVMEAFHLTALKHPVQKRR